MNKKIVAWTVGAIVFILVVLLSIEESRTFLVALVLRIFFFLKHNIVSLLAAFFLVNGKFILKVFIKKVALLSATGLGKRYMIEKVINHNLKIHFVDYISHDVKRLVVYVKENFKDFPIIKQIVAVITFLTSLSFVGKFMGGMLAMKVFVAKFWSFILAIVLKFSTAIIYFFTDYLWGSWIAPIVEVLLFSWMIEWIEKIPFFKKYLLKIYRFFMTLFEWVEAYVEKVFHIPMKRFFKFLAKKIKQYIHRLIEYRKVSAWKRVREVRALKPNQYTLLLQKRKIRKEKHQKIRASLYRKMLEKKEKK